MRRWTFIASLTIMERNVPLSCAFATHPNEFHLVLVDLERTALHGTNNHSITFFPSLSRLLGSLSV